MAIRGLLATSANAIAETIVTQPQVFVGATGVPLGQVFVGANVGDWIVDTVATVGDQYSVGPGFTWVEVPDGTVAFENYRPTGTTNQVDWTGTTYYSTVSPYTNGASIGLTGPVGTEVEVYPASASQPSNTVATRPAISQSEWDNGKRWYFFGGALVASYFDPNSYGTVSTAKAELIERTKIAAKNAMAEQASIYTLVTLHGTADFTTLDTRDYAAYNLSSYNTFLGTQVTNQTATINAETTLTGLYAINPEALDTDPT